MTQTSAILTDLRAGITLTHRDAERLYGCARLAARINDAKKLLGPEEEIVTERLVLRSRKVVARYVLRRRQPDQLALAL